MMPDSADLEIARFRSRGIDDLKTQLGLLSGSDQPRMSEYRGKHDPNELSAL